MTSELEHLCSIMTKLRAPGACGWDRKQTLSSLKKYLIEETYETIDAIDNVEFNSCAANQKEHMEELGDLLFQIVFQSEIQREKGAFDMNDVCRAISDKLIRRHPHIFGDAQKDNSDDNPHWEKIKEFERSAKGEDRLSALDGVPNSMPAIHRAHMLASKAKDVGFDWPNYRGARDKLWEEVAELEEVIDTTQRDNIEHELGDVMLACVDLARHLKFDPEAVLQKATKRFESRFRHMEHIIKLEAKEFAGMPIEVMEEYWQRAKRESKSLAH